MEGNRKAREESSFYLRRDKNAAPAEAPGGKARDNTVDGGRAVGSFSGRLRGRPKLCLSAARSVTSKFGELLPLPKL